MIHPTPLDEGRLFRRKEHSTPAPQTPSRTSSTPSRAPRSAGGDALPRAQSEAVSFSARLGSRTPLNRDRGRLPASRSEPRLSKSNENGADGSTVQLAESRWHETRDVVDYFSTYVGGRVARVGWWAVLCSAMVLFLLTMYHHVPGGDSGELVIASHLWNPAHPPGYPLFTSLGAVMDYVLRWVFPLSWWVSSVAARVTFGTSVLASAATAAIMFQIVATLHIPTTEECNDDAVEDDDGAPARALSFSALAEASKRKKKKSSERTTQPQRPPLLYEFRNALGIRFDVSDAAASGMGRCCGGLVASAFYALSPLSWHYSLQPEVFALNNLFCLVLLRLLQLFLNDNPALSRKPPSTRSRATLASRIDNFPMPFRLKYAALGAFVCGLGMCNQQTVVILALSIISSVLWRNSKSLFTVRTMGILLLCGFAGLAPYALLPLQQLSLREYSWGDVRSISGLIGHVLRWEYGTFQLYSGDHGASLSLFSKVAMYASNVYQEFSLVGVALACIGVVYSLPAGTIRKVLLRVGFSSSRLDRVGLTALSSGWNRSAARRHKEENVRIILNTTMVAMALYVFGFFYLCNLPVEQSPLFAGVFRRFFLQPNLIVVLWIGIGASFVFQRIFYALRDKRTIAICLAVLGLSIMFVAASRFGGMNESGNDFVEQYGKAVLEPLPPRALLLTKGDLITNSVQYLRICEGYRSDVTVLSLEHLTFKWFSQQYFLYPSVVFPGTQYHPYKLGGYSMKELLDANYGNFMIFVAGGFREGDNSHAQTYYTTPFGLSERVLHRSEDFSHEMILEDMDRAIPAEFDLPDSSRYGDETWESVVAHDYWMTRHFQALYWLERAIEHRQSSILRAYSPFGFSNVRIHKESADTCSEMYEEILRQCDKPPASFYLNAHLCLEHRRVHYEGEKRDAMIQRMLELMRAYIASEEDGVSTRHTVQANLQAWEQFLHG